MDINKSEKDMRPEWAQIISEKTWKDPLRPIKKDRMSESDKYIAFVNLVVHLKNKILQLNRKRHGNDHYNSIELCPLHEKTD